MEQREGRLPGAPRVLAAGAAGVAAALCLTPTAAYAQEPGIAPPGSASSSVLTVGDIAAISETSAEANREGGKARAGVVLLNNNPVLNTGGSQEGEGRKGGALFDSGATPVGRIQVAPWEVEVIKGNAERTARGRAAALDLYLVDEDLVHIVLLESKSEAKHSDGKSSSSSSSDGARIKAGNGLLDVTVLHSEASSENGSKTYLVKVNGTEIGTDKQLGSICNATVPSIATVGCLKAVGGTGADGTKTGGAGVATVDVGPAPLDTSVVGARSSSGEGATVKPARTEREKEREEAEQRDAAPATPARDTRDDALPNTGSEVAGFAGLAAAAVAVGSWLQSVGRRRKVGSTA